MVRKLCSAVLVGILFAGGLALAGVEQVATESTADTRALGFALGAQMRVVQAEQGEGEWTPAYGVMFATVGWDNPHVAVEFAVPANLTMLQSELSIDGMVAMSRSWRFGLGLVFRPVAMELTGLRVGVRATADVFSFGFGGVLTGEDLAAPMLGLQPFVSFRVNPW